MNVAHMLIVAALVQCLAACGQKGPLVLPDQEHAHKKIALPKTPNGAQPAATPPAQPTQPAQPVAPVPAAPPAPVQSAPSG